MGDVMVITAARLLRGPVAERIDDAAVLVGGATIVAVGTRAEIDVRGVPHLDFPDGTILPGLVDGHVHLALDPGEGFEGFERGIRPDQFRGAREDDDATLSRAMAAAAATLLAHGITTVRDCGDRGYLSVALREAIAAGELPGPRVLAAGPPLTPPGGHCAVLGGVVDGVEAIRAAVAEHAAAGVDVIKVMASGGQTTAGGAGMWEPQFGVDELRVVVDEAARHGLPVAAHAHGTQSIADAVAAGVATVEHCTWMSGPRTLDQRPEVMAEMAARGIVASAAHHGDWRRMGTLIGDEQIAFQMFHRFRALADAGVTVLPGTDAGIGPLGQLPASLGFYRDIGFAPAEILDMATSGAADVLGLGDVTGRVEPGLAADLLVVQGDPLADLDALQAVQLVVARGNPLRPAG